MVSDSGQILSTADRPIHYNIDTSDAILFDVVVNTIDAESAVRVIDDTNKVGRGDADIDSAVDDMTDKSVMTFGANNFQRYFKPPRSLIFLALLLLVAITVGAAIGESNSDSSAAPRDEVDISGGTGENTVIPTNTTDIFDSSKPTFQPSIVSCIESTNQDIYDLTKLIVEQITPTENLSTLSSPHRKALEWIVCEDGISFKLFDNRDSSTGIISKQAHGTQFGVDSGEAQVLRRYTLATFFFDTPETGAWDDHLNFLLPTVHECQ